LTFNRLGYLSMKGASRLAQQRSVGRIPDQRMLEQVSGLFASAEAAGAVSSKAANTALVIGDGPSAAPPKAVSGIANSVRQRGQCMRPSQCAYRVADFRIVLLMRVDEARQ
jgi:hypothetical protein